MYTFTTAEQVKDDIDSYVLHFNGSPLVVGIDNAGVYSDLVSKIQVDDTKKIIRVSDRYNLDFPPDPSFDISTVSNAAKEKPVVWIGAAQSSMLYGRKKLEPFLIDILGTNFKGPVVILCPFCCKLLESIGKQYAKLGYNIVITPSIELTKPTIYISAEASNFANVKSPLYSMKELLRNLEDGSNATVIYVVTNCSPSYFSESLYSVKPGPTPYQAICQIESAIDLNTKESYGTQEQWQNLLIELQKTGSLAELCKDKLCDLPLLSSNFGEFLQLDPNTSFLCYICLKIYCGNRNDYLAYCLKKSSVFDDFERNLYFAILDIDHDDKRFPNWIDQRRNILADLDENSALLSDYCDQATIKGKDILWYLYEKTEEERAAIIHALACYPYTSDELNAYLTVASPLLHTYLQEFIFDEFNTKVIDQDAELRGVLTRYFQQYKIQKVTNHTDESFLEYVRNDKIAKSYTKLPARSIIVKKLDKKDAQPYFFDALGVEFLSFIQARAEAYDMQMDCSICHCNLPSITCKNKEFYDRFPKDSILKEDRLDELKHKGTKYDFRLTKEPLHLFDELILLDQDLRKFRSALANDTCKRVIILSDHGASRLAVTYQSENDKITLSEPGKHSGRCCPASEDPKLENVLYEDGFAVLTNYQRFKGSRKADVEAHGGATLEETVIPVIVLTRKPKVQQIYFPEPLVECTVTTGTVIKLFANPPLKEPRMSVNGRFYNGVFDGDKHNILFTLPDMRRKGKHTAEIYDGNLHKITLPFETTRKTTTNNLL